MLVASKWMYYFDSQTNYYIAELYNMVELFIYYEVWTEPRFALSPVIVR